jgi:hypothetical protein
MTTKSRELQVRFPNRSEQVPKRFYNKLRIIDAAAYRSTALGPFRFGSIHRKKKTSGGAMERCDVSSLAFVVVSQASMDPRHQRAMRRMANAARQAGHNTTRICTTFDDLRPDDKIADSFLAYVTRRNDDVPVAAALFGFTYKPYDRFPYRHRASSIYVDFLCSSKRCRGGSTMLLAFLHNLAEALDMTRLEMSSTRSARPFYEKLGMDTDGSGHYWYDIDPRTRRPSSTIDLFTRLGDAIREAPSPAAIHRKLGTRSVSRMPSSFTLTTVDP